MKAQHFWFLIFMLTVRCFAVPPAELVLTQATIVNHSEVVSNLINRTLTLSDWNQTGDNDWPNELYDDVDYVIRGDIDFKDLEYSLVIQEGTTVWFWLEIDDELEPEDPGYVTSISKLLFSDNRHIQCGSASLGDDPVK